MKKAGILLTSLLSLVIFLLFPIKTFAAQKIIDIDLTNQRLYAYQDGILVYNFAVSTGKIGTPTPTGGFWPWVKLRYDDMVGGSYAAGNYYYLPDVPYVVYFYNFAYPKYDYYAIHGTYWHNNFGHPMSHGCVNLRTSDMAKLYYWIDPVSFNQYGQGGGTTIIIYGSTPSS